MPNHLTKSDIEARKTDYATQEAAFRKECRVDQDFIHANAKWREGLLAAYVAGFPKGFVHKSLPLAQRVIQSFKSSVMAGAVPDVKDVLPLAEDEKASDAMEARRQITEQFHGAFLYETAMRTSSNPFSELLDHVGGLGAGILCFPFDESKWPKDTEEGYEAKRRTAFPWDPHVVHPLNILVDPYNDPPRDYIIEDEISVLVAKERYPDLPGLPDTGKVKRLVYVSENDYAVYVNDEAVFGGDGVVDNPMGMLWYEFVLSGVGSRDESSDPAYLWQGFVRPLRDIIAIIITNYNLQESAKWKEVYGPSQVKAESIAAAQDAIGAVKLEPMAFVPTTMDVTFGPIFQATEKDTLLREQESVERLFEMLGGPLSGNFRNNETTASGLQQRVALQEAPYQAAKVGTNQAIANMLRKVTAYYKTNIGEKFWMRGGPRKFQMFNPEDLLDDTIIEVSLKPVTDADRAMSVDKDLKELTAGRISGAEYDRRQNIRDTDKLQDERAQEAIRFHPSMVEAAVTVAVGMLMPQQPVPPQGSTPATEAFNSNPVAQNGSMMAALAGQNAPSGPR